MPKLISVGELIDRTWEKFRTWQTPLLNISAWLLLIALLNVIGLALYPTYSKLQQLSNLALSFSEKTGVILFIVTNYILGPLMGVWVFAATARYIEAKFAGQRMNVSGALREGRKAFFPLLYIGILCIGILIGAVLIGLSPTILLEAIRRLTGIDHVVFNMLQIFSVLLGIAGSSVLLFAWGVRYAFAPFVFLAENIRGRAALKRSHEITRHQFWGVCIRLLVPHLIFPGIAALILFTLNFFAQFFLGTAGGLNLDLFLRLQDIVSLVLPLFVTVLINPLVILANILIYKSLREQQKA